jgi:hypothetical protein
MNAVVRNFSTQGFAVFPGRVEAAHLMGLETTLKNLVRRAVERLQTDAARQWHAHGFGEHELLHAGLIALYELDPKMEQYVVDGGLASAAFYRIVADPTLCALAAELVDCAPEDLGLTAPFLRVDLPARYRDLTEKINLPFHQESSYYRLNVSPATGIVLWIPLFDCGPTEGALDLCPGSHAEGALEHEGYYLDPERKRHYRTRAPATTVARFPVTTLDVKRGDLAVQHFHLLHRSGLNQREDRVRYTILARYSNLTAADFKPVSWG